MTAYVSNIIISSGEDFDRTFTLKNPVNNSYLNLSTYSARSFLKKHPSSLNVTVKFNVTIVAPVNGELKLSLGSSITSLLKPGRYSYDILLDDGVKKKKVVEGSALVVAGITT